MKYIDADKLIATLERQNVDKKIIQPLIRIIDSLQQEHVPENEKTGTCEDASEYIRTIKSLIADFIRDKQPGDVDYYQKIYDWLDKQ